MMRRVPRLSLLFPGSLPMLSARGGQGPWPRESRHASWRAFSAYSGRRREERGSGARRILADFLIGAPALQCGFRLLTLDEGLYRGAFPRLAIASV
jgi:hypothetical protein